MRSAKALDVQRFALYKVVAKRCFIIVIIVSNSSSTIEPPVALEIYSHFLLSYAVRSSP